MKKLIFLFLIFIGSFGYAQSKTDVSLFMKADPGRYLDSVGSYSGNLFHKIGHHGPAIENQWFGLRIYFDKRVAIDVYSKSKPGLELRKAHWYPTKEQQKTGWGADYYKVGKTLGLGGIRLWDGKNVVLLNPVTKRSAKVKTDGKLSSMEMLSEGISYKGHRVDILIRVTVYSDDRKAKVEAFSQTGFPVQFVTGINYHKGIKVSKSENYLATWGIHPEDGADEKVAVGAALIFNPEDFEKQMEQEKQCLMVSKPSSHLETWITSANERESEVNTNDKLLEFLNKKTIN